MAKTKSRKILHVIVGLDTGGAERFLYRLVEAHKNHPEFTHNVISLTSKGVIGEQLEKIGVGVVALGMSSIFQVPKIFLKILNHMRTIEPDVVQCWMYYSDILGGIAARTLGYKKVIWGIRNSHFEGGGSLLKRFVRKLCAYLSYFIPEKIACVAETAKQVHVGVGYDMSKMVVLPNGFELEQFKPSPEGRCVLRNQLGLLDHQILIGSIGRYCKAKDHRNFIDAASKAIEINENLRFLMIGRGVTVDNEALMKQIRFLGLSDHISLVGERYDIINCLSAMDIFCLHSETEGFPNVLGEAMSAGIPCITTKAGDSEFILGDSGIVVRSGGPQELGDAMIKMSSLTDEARRELGDRGRKRIEDHFTLQSSVVRFEALYI